MDRVGQSADKRSFWCFSWLVAAHIPTENTMKTNFSISIAVAVAVFAAISSARKFTVKNNCGYTVWPALFTDLHASPSKPNHPTGWKQDPHQTVSFEVPNAWRAGRIWVCTDHLFLHRCEVLMGLMLSTQGRRGCNFSKGPTGPTQCLDGGCNGGLECDQTTGTGVPPATLAEFNLNANGVDYFDGILLISFTFSLLIFF